MMRRSFLFEQRIRQLKAQVFIRPGIKNHRHSGARTFYPTDEMHVKPAAVKEAARMRQEMPAACLIDVKANRLLADRALGQHRVKSPSSYQLYEFGNPD
jgi:hypothetical protein